MSALFTFCLHHNTLWNSIIYHQCKMFLTGHLFYSCRELNYVGQALTGLYSLAMRRMPLVEQGMFTGEPGVIPVFSAYYQSLSSFSITSCFSLYIRNLFDSVHCIVCVHRLCFLQIHSGRVFFYFYVQYFDLFVLSHY